MTVFLEGLCKVSLSATASYSAVSFSLYSKRDQKITAQRAPSESGDMSFIPTSLNFCICFLLPRGRKNVRNHLTVHAGVD